MEIGSRSLHDQAFEELIEKLKNYIDMDLNTSRRFVTLITVVQGRASSRFDFN